METRSAYAAAAVELFASAVALQLCVLFAVWWHLRREDRYLGWFSAWALAAAVAHGVEAALFAAPVGTLATALVLVRTLALGALTALVVPPVCLLARRRIAWWLVVAIGAVYILRAALTGGTDLVWSGDFDDYGLPLYEPLRDWFMVTPLVTLGLLVPYVRRIEHRGHRRALYSAMAAAVVLVPISALQDDALLRGLATGAWSWPMIAALAVVGLQRVLGQEAAQRRLVKRQQALLQLSRTDGDDMAVVAEEHLSRDLGHPVAVAVTPAPPRDPEGDGAAGEVETALGEDPAGNVVVDVRGHRSRVTGTVRAPAAPLGPSEEGFARAVLHLVAGLADRAGAESDLRQAALHDVVTGLPNRTLLTDRLEHAVDRRDRHGGVLAVLFCDLDEFKAVNDTLGHAAGDRLLREVATALLSAARSSDTVARFGGDEFVVVAEGLRDREAAALLAERMRDAVTRVLNPATGRGVRMSVGVACAGRGEGSATRLLRAADLAMYDAKTAGGVAVALGPDAVAEGPAAGRGRLEG